MRALVTGGAGFIGAHLCRRLLTEGYEVVVLDNLLTGREENLEDLFDQGLRLVRLDVTDFIDVPGGVDAVIHLASAASPQDYLRYPIQTLKVGSLGTHRALGLAKEKGARFLLASTSEVYGDPQVHPQEESYWGSVNPIGPRGVYDEAKRFAEAMTMAYHRTHGVRVAIARIFNTYGPRMRVDDGRAFPNFVVQALRGEPLTVHGDGLQTRSLCYVDDTVEGLWRLLRAGITGPVNIGNPREHTVLEIARLVARSAGAASALTFMERPVDDPQVRQPDIALARRMLGWEPTTTLEDGIARTLPWFREQLDRALDDVQRDTQVVTQ